MTDTKKPQTRDEPEDKTNWRNYFQMSLDVLHHENTMLKTELAIAQQRAEKLAEALEFYADPETYFAISFLADPPCGDFMKDGSQTELGKKPGRRARKALAEYRGGK